MNGKDDAAMNFLASISPIELFFLSVAIALVIVVEFNYDQMNVIGNTFIGIGSLVIIAATQGAYLNGLKDAAAKEECLKKQLAQLQGQRVQY